MSLLTSMPKHMVNLQWSEGFAGASALCIQALLCHNQKHERGGLRYCPTYQAKAKGECQALISPADSQSKLGACVTGALSLTYKLSVGPLRAALMEVILISDRRE